MSAQGHVGFISRTESFSAAHRLHSSQLSAEGNRAVYGKCNHGNYHGHNYKFDVVVRGVVNGMTGMIVNVSDLKEWIRTEVLDIVDHKNLDLDVEFFKSCPSTSENICVFIWIQLKEVFDKQRRKLEADGYCFELFEVRVYETEKNVAFFRGSDVF